MMSTIEDTTCGTGTMLGFKANCPDIPSVSLWAEENHAMVRYRHVRLPVFGSIATSFGRSILLQPRPSPTRGVRAIGFKNLNPVIERVRNIEVARLISSDAAWFREQRIALRCGGIVHGDSLIGGTERRGEFGLGGFSLAAELVDRVQAGINFEY